MKKKIRVGVIFGGPSSEREISLITGNAICKNLDKKKYEVLPIEMSIDNKFFLDRKFYLELNSGSQSKAKTAKKELIALGDNQKRGIDVVFIAMHGAPGENGAMQGMLESLGIPYTGSGVLASSLAMNKVYSAEIYFANGLAFPQFVNFKKWGWKNNRQVVLDDVNKNIGYPCVVKPVDQGSSVGVSIVKNEKEFIKITNKTIKKFPWLMAQKFIKGKEATCGVIEKNGNPVALPPTHIVPNLGSSYDYESKYEEGGSTHICPADFPEEINHKMKELAVKTHLALGCKGMSRTDMFYGDDGEIYIIETNTIPGMTPVSLFPEAANKAGISFEKMLDLIIKAGL